VAPIPLSALVDQTAWRPGPADPVRDRMWLALRAETQRMLLAGAFDPRHILSLAAADREAWRARRRSFLKVQLQSDPRVDVER
jgi:hypothetical protein